MMSHTYQQDFEEREGLQKVKDMVDYENYLM